MKFPSIGQLQKDGTTAATRFPFCLLFGALASGIAIYLIEIESSDNLWLLNLLLTFALGIPLYFCIEILAERKQFTSFQRQISWICGLLLLVSIYLSFPAVETFTNTRVPYIRYTIFNVAIHLMVAFLPYFGSENEEGFWNYNKILFIRLVQGIYYSLVVFVGISLALLAINALFEANIQAETFGQIFAVTFGLFNTWFFLAGIPRNFEMELSLIDYPKGLKIFTQFILIPLLLIYLCILYFYGAKILLTGDWPKGIVSYLIIAISVLGIFTTLLLYPYQRWKESGWIKKFSRGYYYFLIPLVILLFIAIGMRIQEYGLTVNRYIIALMGVWLGFIAIYFSIGKKKIKTIPISLALFMIFSSFGPWGMFSLSERNQRNRLASILTENKILVDDKIQNEVIWRIGEKGSIKPSDKLRTITISSEDLYEVNSIIQYLQDYHGVENIYAWFEQDLKTLLEKSNQDSNKSSNDSGKFLVESMGLTYVPYYQRLDGQNASKEISLVTYDNYQLEITDFDYLSSINIGTWSTVEESFSDGKYHLEIDRNNKRNLILRWTEGQMVFDLTRELKELSNQYGGGYHEVLAEELVITKKKENIEIKLQLKSLNISGVNDKLELQSLEGLLLINENQ